MKHTKGTANNYLHEHGSNQDTCQNLDIEIEGDKIGRKEYVITEAVLTVIVRMIQTRSLFFRVDF